MARSAVKLSVVVDELIRLWPEIKRNYTERSCVPAARIAMQVLNAAGFPGRSVEVQASALPRHLADEVRRQAAQEPHDDTEVQVIVSDEVTGSSWHVVVVVPNRGLLDLSAEQLRGGVNGPMWFAAENAQTRAELRRFLQGAPLSFDLADGGMVQYLPTGERRHLSTNWWSDRQYWAEPVALVRRRLGV